jgi:hypothetical protein
LPFLRQHGGRFASASGPNAGAISIQLKIIVSASAIVRRMAKKQYSLRLPGGRLQHGPESRARVCSNRSCERFGVLERLKCRILLKKGCPWMRAGVRECLLHFQQEPTREYIPEYI